MFSRDQQLLWKTEVLLFLSLPSQILKFPRKAPKINYVYTSKDWDSCGYEVRTSQQSQLLIAGEHPVHIQPLRLATHSASATVAPPRTKGPFSMIWQILPREECWTIIHGWLHTSLRVSRPSGANYLGARACPSLGSPTQAVLTLRSCSLITAGYLRREALYFTKCHPVYFWYRLTREQRLGFKALYKKRMQMSREWPPKPFFSAAQALVVVPHPCAQSSLHSISLYGWRLLSHLLPIPWPPPAPVSLLFPAPLTLPFSLYLYSDPCLFRVALWTGVGRGWQQALGLSPPLGSAMPPLLAPLPSTWCQRVCVAAESLWLPYMGRKPVLVLHVCPHALWSLWMDQNPDP